MRLINTSTLKLEEFFDSRTPEYVVLSHTWGRNEISFQQFQNGVLNDKIKNCCKQAQKDGFQYVWVDTCCIDKTSSSELSEAINSMYRWYKHSSICYTFLEDYSDPSPKSNWWERIGPDTDTAIERLRTCRWFTRGWTLQETIAPSTVAFYDAHWNYFGTRMSLQEAISAITRIPLSVLNTTKSPQEYNVAVRMSWASKRRTTRLEDEAYCLMGLFDVNMPMLYGEGHRAFQRLQEEIIRRYDDYSLFAWVSQKWGAIPFLASSPFDFDEDRLEGFRFEELANLTGREFGNFNGIVVPPVPTIGSRGISIKLPLLERQGECWAAICSLKHEPLRIFCLRVTQDDAASQTYTRIHAYADDHLIPHKVRMIGRRVGGDELSKFVYTDMNLAISASSQSRASEAFGLIVHRPMDESTRIYSLKWMKIYSKIVEDIRASTTYESPNEKVLLFRYANENSDMITGGLVVGLRNGTPWCNILRHMFQADFYSIFETENHMKLMDALTKCTNEAETPAKTRDLCRMRIGSRKHNAYMATRVTRVGGGSDAQRPRLVLEIAIDPLGTGSTHTEVGVLDCNPLLYRWSSIVRNIGEGDIAIQRGEEPPHWRIQGAGALVIRDQYSS